MTIGPILLQDSINDTITFQARRAKLESIPIPPPSSFIKELKENKKTQINMRRDCPIRKLEKTTRQADEPGGFWKISTTALNHRSSASDDAKVESKHRARYKKLLNESLERQKDKDKSEKKAEKKKKKKSMKNLKKISKGKTKKSKETSKTNDNYGSDSTIDTLVETYSANHVLVAEGEPDSDIDLFCDSDSDESSLWSDDEYAHVTRNHSKSFCELGGSFWQLEVDGENLRDFTSKMQTA